MLKKVVQNIIDYLGINKNFLFIWLATLAIVFFIQANVKDSDSFVGFVSSRGSELSVKSSARIVNIYVLPGEEVKKGQLLAELQSDELEMKISEVKSQLDLISNQQTLIESIESQENSIDPTIRNLKKQLSLLKKAKRDLFIFSAFSGKIENINYKKGENVAPYSPILTVQELKADLIQGYIHESQIGEVKINQKLVVSSLTGLKRSSTGQVLSVGSSLVNFPTRLLKDPNRPVWGRQIIIKLSEKNDFILGEKVFIDHKSNVSFIKETQASSLEISQRELEKIEKNRVITKREVLLKKEFEASGIIYLSDLKKYLVISDAGKKGKHINASFVNINGEVSYDTEISYLNEMKDVESITLDNKGNIYFLSSLSKGKRSKDLLILRREGLSFKLLNKVSMHSLLKSSILESRDQTLISTFIKKGKFKIDIEGMTYKEGSLLLGLRAPLTEQNEAIILKVENIEQAIKKEYLDHKNLSIWKKIKLENTNRVLSISGLALCTNHIYITAAPESKKGRYGALYKINHDQNDNYIEKILNYNNDKPEGVFFNEDNNEMAVSFDHGAEQSKVIFYEL